MNQNTSIYSNLIQSYNRHAAERETRTIANWKIVERQRFLDLLKSSGKITLLDLGAGTGRDSRFFQEQGLAVTCVDLSPEMCSRNQKKGIAACQMNFCQMAFKPATFEAIWALNSLLHVPKSEIENVLKNIREILKPGGLLFLGIYGGKNFEGIWEADDYRPKRFFSFFTDQKIQELVQKYFKLCSFRAIDLDLKEIHFQSLFLEKI